MLKFQYNFILNIHDNHIIIVNSAIKFVLGISAKWHDSWDGRSVSIYASQLEKCT